MVTDAKQGLEFLGQICSRSLPLNPLCRSGYHQRHLWLQLVGVDRRRRKASHDPGYLLLGQRKLEVIDEDVNDSL
jgi:hypothetical protein